MNILSNFYDFQTNNEQNSALLYDEYSFPQDEIQETWIDFKKSKKDKVIICLENTQKVLDCMGITIHYNVIKKKTVMVSTIPTFNGDIVDYKAILIMEVAVKSGYQITKNIMLDHLNTIARKNKVNPVSDYYKKCHANWDGKSRIKEVYYTLNSSMDEELGMAYFKKWCVQAVRLAENSLLLKLNQEFVIVLQGDQNCGKTSWLKSLFTDIIEYFKEGLELRPENKDCVIECTSYYVTELGELDGTMSKADQASLKAFITRPDDEFRRPYERTSEKHPRTTVLCATVNDEEFLKDKTGNRRYAVIPVGETVDRLDHIELDQFWGEITHYANDPNFDHRLSKDEFKQQQKENEQYEIVNETELIVKDSFYWGVDIKLWKEMETHEIALPLNLSTKSKLLGGALRKNGAKRIKRVKGQDKRGWLVPPMKESHNRDYSRSLH